MGVIDSATYEVMAGMSRTKTTIWSIARDYSDTFFRVLVHVPERTRIPTNAFTECGKLLAKIICIFVIHGHLRKSVLECAVLMLVNCVTSLGLPTFLRLIHQGGEQQTSHKATATRL